MKNGLRNLRDPKVFIEYLNKIQDVYKNIEENKPSRNCNVWIAFDDKIADMISDKRFSPLVTEQFTTRRNLYFSIVFIKQFSFQVPKDAEINCTHIFHYEYSKQFVRQIFPLKTLWIFTKNVLQNHWLILLLRKVYTVKYFFQSISWNTNLTLISQYILTLSSNQTAF